MLREDGEPGRGWRMMKLERYQLEEAMGGKDEGGRGQ